MAKHIEGSMLLLLSAEEGRTLRKIVAVPNVRRRRDRKATVLIGAFSLFCLVGLLALGLVEPEWGMVLIKHLMSFLFY